VGGSVTGNESQRIRAGYATIPAVAPGGAFSLMLQVRGALPDSQGWPSRFITLCTSYLIRTAQQTFATLERARVFIAIQLTKVECIMKESGIQFVLRAIFLFLLVLVTTLLSMGSPARAVEHSSPHVIRVTGDVEGTHDPSLMKEDDTWYLFSTATERKREGELPVRCSKDLQRWQRCGYVLPGIPEWVKQESPETRDLWAPDISYFNGKYHLYYAFSAFGKNTSGIALLTNKTLDPKSPQFHWDDQGLVLRSLASDDFNAIDPNLVIDEQGHAWLAFGSFWSGIKMRRVDRTTGKLSAEDTKLYSLASRGLATDPRTPHPGLPPDRQAVEAPFVIHHGGYYYLFVSFDLCCRGAKSTYRTMVGRSRDVTGPFVDVQGRPMMNGGGTTLLVGNQRWAGPGGESLFLDRECDIIVFHAYDAVSGKPSLQISTIGWQNGWPQAALEDGASAANR
jgi:arabinan endo-1,5-alpha-L-arabinosidase